MKQVSVRFSDKEHLGLVEESANQERSINEIVREAVREYLDQKKPS